MHTHRRTHTHTRTSGLILLAKDVSFALTFAAGSLAFLLPHLLTTKTLPFWHIYFMVTLYFTTTPFAVPLEQPVFISVYQTKAFVLTFAVSFVCLRLPVLILTNMLYTLGNVAGMVMSVPRDTDLPMGELLSLEVSCWATLPGVCWRSIRGSPRSGRKSGGGSLIWALGRLGAGRPRHGRRFSRRSLAP